MQEIIFKQYNLVQCESLESLTERLNSDLNSGRTIRFHNNGGHFMRDKTTKNVVKEYIVTSFWPSCDFPEDVRSENDYGICLRRSLESEENFFSICQLSDLFSSQLISGYDFSKKTLIYGLKDNSIGIKRQCFVSQGLFEDPEYSPVSGILTPKLHDGKEIGLFDFEGIDRIFYKK